MMTMNRALVSSELTPPSLALIFMPVLPMTMNGVLVSFSYYYLDY